MCDLKQFLMKNTLAFLSMLLFLLIFGSWARADVKTIRIGFQKSSVLMSIVKGQGALEKALAPLGVTVQWNEFTSGAPIVEALNAAAIDLTGDMGDAVPLFAQAAGTNFAYFLQEDPSPKAEAIVVRKDSPIKTVADLKGKKIAMPKASATQYLTIAATAKAGLDFNKDITAAYLQPAEARIALEAGSVDAWACWEPYLSMLDIQNNIRHIVDASECGVAYRRYFLASNDFLENNASIVNIIVNELSKVSEWIRSNPDQAAQLLSPILNHPVQVIKLANSRRSLHLSEVNEEALESQQDIATAFARLSLLPQLNVRESKIWKSAGK
ncbi:MAG: aliphatic sulfonate ABC transporter substrate-binding protein [Desulfovibrio sp.]|jgi:sulfonate transport system substrate-binding protein|nr:aliphatic sulfonate ABC transporter substrate-binding protein [Desulfovibrio sp.]